jgi:hypothetical protein
MPKIAVCICCYNCCLYWTCFFVLLTVAISSMPCYYTIFFLSSFFVLNIIYVLDLESVLFDSKNFYNVLLLTCSIILLIVFICGSMGHK